MPNQDDVRRLADEITKKLADQGRIIEGGWQAMRLSAISKDAPEIQLHEMRNAFFAGAQHLFGSIMSILEPGREPTEKDLKRLTLIHNELQDFIEDYEKRFVPK